MFETIRLLCIARSRIGARDRVCGAFALAVLAGAVLSSGARAYDDGPGPLPWRVGASVGFSVDAAAFPDSAGQRLEVYLRLPPPTLVQLAGGQTHTGALRFDLKLQPARGRSQSASQEFVVSRSDTVGGQGRVLVFPFRVTPGVCRLTVRMQARRYMLPGSGSGRTETVSVDGEVAVPGPQAGREISDIEFIWSEPESAAAGGFTRGQMRRLPNPERLYGLYETTLRAAVVARASGEPRPWHWVARASDAAGRVVAQRESTGVASHSLAADVTFDLSSEPAGRYDLEFKAWQEGDPGALSRRARFSVGWDRGTWERSAKDIEDDAHFLLKPEEEERFAHMLPGEQEAFLNAFWKRRDPTPETADNEARRLFLTRVAFANRAFSRSLDKGMFSDQGRVFIRYGEPSEIRHELMPGRDYELNRVIQQYVSINDRPIGDIGDNTPGADMRPFELWVYEGEVLMPLSDDFVPGETRHLRKPIIFLFVDEKWVGDYRLRYTTE